MTAKPLKVSYCTTCKGRLHHLKQTLPANMAAEKGNPNVEFVVLDYGSEDGLGDWIQQNYQKEIDSGRLRYARYETPHFEMAHAKNMAHRVATGDILCNIDADNFIASNFSGWLHDQFTLQPHSVVTSLTLNVAHGVRKKIHKTLGGVMPKAGSQGRIVMLREDFQAIRGYDERYSAWGADDLNMVQRAMKSDIQPVILPKHLWGDVILHPDAERLEHFSPADKVKSARLFANNRFEWICHAIKILSAKPMENCNPNGNVGCGTVHINFSPEPTVIGPLQVKDRTAAVPAAQTDTKAEPEQGRKRWAAQHARPAHLPSRQMGGGSGLIPH